MTAVLLSAGSATRLGGLAPDGCKAMTPVGGKTMVEWWSQVTTDLLVVCRSEHLGAIAGRGIDFITCDGGGGAAVALRQALDFGAEGPVMVIYADTWMPAWAVPTDTDWCAVAAAAGGRSWDVVEDDLVAYRHVAGDDVALVCIGLYSFGDVDRLKDAVAYAIEHAEKLGAAEAGMADVVNHYGNRFVPVDGWQDIGDPDALAAWRPM